MNITQAVNIEMNRLKSSKINSRATAVKIGVHPYRLWRIIAGITIKTDFDIISKLEENNIINPLKLIIDDHEKNQLGRLNKGV